MRGVFSQEANTEAERLVYSKTNRLNAADGVARGLNKSGKECLLGLYELSKDVE